MEWKTRLDLSWGGVLTPHHLLCVRPWHMFLLTYLLTYLLPCRCTRYLRKQNILPTHLGDGDGSGSEDRWIGSLIWNPGPSLLSNNNCFPSMGREGLEHGDGSAFARAPIFNFGSDRGGSKTKIKIHCHNAFQSKANHPPTGYLDTFLWPWPWSYNVNIRTGSRYSKDVSTNRNQRFRTMYSKCSVRIAHIDARSAPVTLTLTRWPWNTNLTWLR